MSRIMSVILAMGLGLLGSCAKVAEPWDGGECNVHADCDPGDVCDQATCKKLCTVRDGCEGDFVCNDGFCIASELGEAPPTDCVTDDPRPECDRPPVDPPPEIWKITGDGSVDYSDVGESLGELASRRVRTAINIYGDHLDGSTVVLTDSNGAPGALETSLTSSNLVVAMLPTDGMPVDHQYKLSVKNQNGGDDVSTWVLKGEDGHTPTPDEVRNVLFGMPDIHRGASWGRYYEAEGPPLATIAVIGEPVQDLKASGQFVRQIHIEGDDGVEGGVFYAFQSTTISPSGNDPISLSRSVVSARLRIASSLGGGTGVCPGSDDDYLSLSCKYLPDEEIVMVDLDRLNISPRDWLTDAQQTATDCTAGGDAALLNSLDATWKIFSITCDFLPSQQNQEVSIEFLNTHQAGGIEVDISLDYIRIQPIPVLSQYADTLPPPWTP